MKMKTISFENGTHITLPDEEGRALVFATGVDNGTNVYSVHGPEHGVMCMILELTSVICREAKDRELMVEFVRVLAEQLKNVLEEEQKNAEKD